MTGKLYGTLGPACADTDTLRALLRAGMRGVRLNLSHGPLEERAPWLDRYPNPSADYQRKYNQI